MFSFIGWIIVGLIAGFLARALVPGRQSLSLLKTIGLGLLGSLLGGFVSAMIFGHDPADSGFHTSGIIMSTIGAIVLLVGYLSYSRRHPNAR